jgi:hypothetical protein
MLGLFTPVEVVVVLRSTLRVQVIVVDMIQ